MRFTIEMNLEGAAFQDNREGEAQHIAHDIAEQLRRAMLSMSDQGVRPWMLTTAYAYDSNGNMVATITPNVED